MTATLQTTLVRLLNQTIEQCADPDPNNELMLTQQEWRELRERALTMYEREADRVLQPYGCTLLGNGEIIRRDINDQSVLEWDEDDVKERLGMIDVSEVLPG